MRKIQLCAPSRIYEDYPGGRFSYAAMVDYFSEVGLPGIDMSFESLSKLEDSAHAVLYGALRKAKEKQIDIPTCHLSFYMPDPKNVLLMAKYQKELIRGIDAAAMMRIPLAVIHPIAWYSQDCTYGDWVRANMAFLSPLAEYAKAKNVRLCIENMPSEKESPENHLYGSCALNISALAQKLGVGVCWDVGHANISGFMQSEQLAVLRDKLDVLHIHDNDGKKDAHLLPFEGTVDWEDVAKGLQDCNFKGVMSVEVTAWALSGDRETRKAFGGKILSRAQKLMKMSELF